MGVSIPATGDDTLHALQRSRAAPVRRMTLSLPHYDIPCLWRKAQYAEAIRRLTCTILTAIMVLHELKLVIVDRLPDQGPGTRFMSPVFFFGPCRQGGGRCNRQHKR